MEQWLPWILLLNVYVQSGVSLSNEPYFDYNLMTVDSRRNPFEPFREQLDSQLPRERLRRAQTVTAAPDILPEIALPTETPIEKISAVRFGSDCSARNIKTLKGHDMMLKCEMWIPFGSTLIWYKGNKRESVQHHDVPKDNPQESIGRYEQEYNMVATYYLDCVSLSDQGNYSLAVVTPGGQIFRRDFLIWVDSRFDMQFCCNQCRRYRRYSARIVEFAKTAVGKVGTKLYLPCRKEGYYGIIVSWSKDDGGLKSHNYNITAKGDLEITRLSEADNGYFSCKTFSKYMGSEFYVTTFVQVIS